MRSKRNEPSAYFSEREGSNRVKFPALPRVHGVLRAVYAVARMDAEQTIFAHVDVF